MNSENAQFNILEDIATGKPLDIILGTLVRLIEANLEGSRCSILIVEPDSNHLRVAAAPNLPPEYNDSVDKLPIGPNIGSCGTAAFLGVPVFTSDTSTDPNWQNFRDLVTEHNIGACWSTPILSQRTSGPEGKRTVLGTFGVYPKEKGLPENNFLPWMERAQHLACLALETDRINRALEKSEARFRGVVDYAADSIFLIDKNFRIVDLNRKACEELQWSREQLIGSTFAEIDTQISEGGLRDRLPPSKDEERSFETVYRRKDGTSFPVEVRVRCFTSQDECLCVSIARNISERKETEFLLKRQNNLIEKTQALAGLGCFELDLNSQQLTWSDALFDIYGLNSAEFTPSMESFLSRVHPDDRSRLEKSIKESLSSLSTFQSEERIIRPDGTIRSLQSIAKVECDAQGKPTHVLGACLDVTERRRMEKHMAESQKMEAVGRLAGGVAHDFNNLLTVIGGQAELLASGMQDTVLIKEATRDILEASRRATGLTTQLLAFSRHQPVEPSVVELNNFIQNSLKLTRRLVSENIKIISELDQKAAPCRINRNQMEQVLMNLIVNARDALPDGGQIRVSSRSGLSPQDAQIANLDASARLYVELTVEDTGIGIPESVLPKIFDPFFTTKEVGEGTGLGLAVVHGVVKQYSGHLQVSTQQNVGSKFRILLPQCDAEESTDSPSVSEPLSKRGSETILVVEDEDSVRRLVAKVLRREGYRVLQAEHADAALELANSNHYDLLLTDVVMPGLSGIELSQLLRKIRPRLPVLFMSGYTGHDSALNTQSDDTLEFMSKPFKTSALSLQVRALLDRVDRL